MNRTNSKVDAYLSKLETWQDESRALRRILLDCQLTEELKWGKPCYTFNNSNIAIIQGFSHYCALMFFKGSLFKDTHHILVQPGKNTQAGRQIRFTEKREIAEMEAILRAYIHEAIEVEKAGLEVGDVIPETFLKDIDVKPPQNTWFQKSFKPSWTKILP